ncbi:MAG TPA: hypothetical protein VM889_09185 [Candidatus Thermoplasmatota archaeon]|nr:hypothetical protein [Candidatus Thermoplasmatota archaeon]
MPAMVFAARCPSCRADAKFIEFKAEPCTPGAEGERRYGFRCMACKAIVDEVVDAKGARQAWADGKHVEKPA